MIFVNALTHGSMLRSQIQPEQLASWAKANHMPTIGLCDIGSLSQCYHYWSAMKAVNKLPLLGTQFQICSDYSSLTRDNPANKRLMVYATNLEGWKDLLYLFYLSNSPSSYHGGPRLSIQEIAPHLTQNLAVIGFCDLNDTEWNELKDSAAHLFCGINPAEGLSEAVSGVPTIAVHPNYYLEKSQSQVNKELLLSKFKGTDEPILQNQMLAMESAEDIQWNEEAIANTYKFYALFDEFDITNPEGLPEFDCGDLTEAQFLRQICEQELENRGMQEHADRLNYELEVIEGNGMSGYFLVMADITKYCRDHDILLGTARGSAGGALISYLTGIIKVNPMEYNLLFERFYSKARKEYPDIDIDVQPSRRDELESYISKKYGADNFMQYATFSTLKGAAALKMALSNSDKDIAVDEQNEITKNLPFEGKIADELKTQNLIHKNQSTVLYALLNEPDTLSKWCTLSTEHAKLEFDGPYAEEFDLSIQLNKVNKARSRHASAFVLSPEPLYRRVPVCWDEKQKRHIIEVDMKAGEAMGCVKLDLLGLTLLDEYAYVKEILNGEAI